MALKIFKTCSPFIIGLLCQLSYGFVQAQEIEFSDDFSVDSIRFSSDSRFGSSSPSVNTTSAGIQFTTSDTASEYTNISLRDNNHVDSYIATIRLDENSFENADDGSAFVGFIVNARIGNDVADNGNSSIVGDIDLGVRIAIGPEFAGFNVCAGRNGEAEYENFLMFDNGTNNCTNLGPLTVAPGNDFNIGFEVNAAESTVTFITDDNSNTFSLPGTLFEAYDKRGVDLVFEQDGVPGSASILLSRVNADGVVTDLAPANPIVDRYDVRSEPGVIVGVENGAVDVNIASSVEADSWEELDLRILNPTDYLEAEFYVSSQSVIDSWQHRVGAFLETQLYNDVADGGTEGRLGDVRAILGFEARGDGLRRVEGCLYRYNEADSGDRTGLLNPDDPDRRCITLPIRFEFDKAQRASIELDKEAATLTFRVNNVAHTVQLSGNFYQAAQPYALVRVGSRNDGLFIGTIDNVKNSPDALTAAETASGATTPTPFPPALTESELATNSELDTVYDFLGPLNFVDNFEADTSVFGHSRWPRDTTDAGYGYYDGAMELQVSAMSEDIDQGSSGAIDYFRPTDSIIVRGSVSTRSDVLPGDSEASLDIESVMYNDTADNGFNDREGDISAKIRLVLRGDGRMQARAEMQRRDVDGNNQRLEIFDGNRSLDFSERFNISLSADTEYLMGIVLDRVNNTISFSLDEHTVVVPLPTGTFQAARPNTQIRAYHRGSSGRAVVRLHSVSFDEYNRDFASMPPAIAPYRPAYEARDGTEIRIEDGRLKLVSDGRIAGFNNPRIVGQGKSRYVGASIELSSESVVTGDSEVFIGVSGNIYNDTADVTETRVGDVFAALRLSLNGAGERYVRTCAWRATSESFDDDIELLGGDPMNCPRMNFIPELDAPYDASIAVDEIAKTLTFTFADEVLVYNISGEVFDNNHPFNGVRAQADESSKVVAYADNLAFVKDAVPLAESSLLLSRDITGDVIGSTPGSESPGDGGASGGSSGGGGCSIVSSRADPFMVWLLLCSVGVMLYRRRYNLK